MKENVIKKYQRLSLNTYTLLCKNVWGVEGNISINIYLGPLFL